MGDRVKRLAVLGATGSIGRQTLEVVRTFPHRFEVIGLAAGRNLDLFANQCRQFQPKLVSIQSPSGRDKLSSKGAYEPEYLSLDEMACHPDIDVVVVATSGKAGLTPILAAISARKRIALANKEVLVMAGEVVMDEAKRHGVEILPIDSEHSAIWQCLRGEEKGEVTRLILTASGGPFWNCPAEDLAHIVAEEALQHPTWQMGKKVTIDSATMMNKGMEVIEARWLFDVPFESIEVLIHPESIVHSMVEFVDGTVKAQLSQPDMRLPILHALSYPERWPAPWSCQLNLSKIGSIGFVEVDGGRFPCLDLAIEAGRKGGTYPAVLSAADEIAVELFLSNRIGFLDIAKIVEKTLDQHQGVSHPSLEEILVADAWARKTAANLGLR